MAHLSEMPVMGWKSLWRRLQTMVDAINTNEPVAGHGLRVDQRRGGGTLISLADQPKNTTGNQSGVVGDGGGGSDPHVLASSISWHRVKWQTVNVVDPSTCAQSTIKVLAYTGDTNDIVTLDFMYYVWVDPTPHPVS